MEDLVVRQQTQTKQENLQANLGNALRLNIMPIFQESHPWPRILDVSYKLQDTFIKHICIL